MNVPKDTTCTQTIATPVLPQPDSQDAQAWLDWASVFG